jgi:hypothetical protein
MQTNATTVRFPRAKRVRTTTHHRPDGINARRRAVVAHEAAAIRAGIEL